MRILSFTNLDRVAAAVEEVVNVYKNSHLYQGDAAKCSFGEITDATGDVAIREAFFQYLQWCVKKSPIDNEFADVVVFTLAADKLATAIENVAENEAEIFFNREEDFDVNPSESRRRSYSFGFSRRPRLYIGKGQIDANPVR